MKTAWLILTLPLLSGCAGGPTAQIQSPAPQSAAKPQISASEARRIILANRGRLWKDPESIRDSSVGEPHGCMSTGGPALRPASCVCLELNAKNSLGGYTGIKRTIMVFPDGGELETLDGGVLGFQEYCSGLRPFPEMNGKRA